MEFVSSKRRKNMKLKPLDDRISREAERGRADNCFGSRHSRHRQGEDRSRAKCSLLVPDAGATIEGQHFPLDVKVGDIVLYSKYGGTEITHGGQDLLILTSRDVLAIVGK